METALNAMSFGGSQFMIDADGVGVNVTRSGVGVPFFF